MSEPQVRGGAGSVSARLEDMRTSADALGGFAGDLEVLLGDLLRAEADLTGVLGLLSPQTALALEAASARFAAAAIGADADLRTLAVGLSAAADGYESADALAAEALAQSARGLAAGAGWALRFAAPGIVVAGTAVAVGGAQAAAGFALARETGLLDLLEERTGVDTEALASAGVDAVLSSLGDAVLANPRATEVVIGSVLPGVALGILGVPAAAAAIPVPGSPIPRDARTLTGLLLTAGRGLGLFGGRDAAQQTAGQRAGGGSSGAGPAAGRVGGSGPSPVGTRMATRRPDVEVTRTTGRTPHASRAPDSLSELYRRELGRHRGHANGQVRIEGIRGADGRRRWIVYIPATTDWSPHPSGNTTDTTTNLEAASGADSAMHEVVRTAIADAGIPAGEEVMLVGYSQGGIVATSLAADPDPPADVAAVVTVGSPVGGIDVPSDVDVLSVEHAEDIVPSLDGEQNPDEAHWTTVRSSIEDGDLASRPSFAGADDAEIAAELSRPAYAHSGDHYLDTISALEADGQPDIARYRERTGGFFDGEVEISADYEGTRR